MAVMSKELGSEMCAHFGLDPATVASMTMWIRPDSFVEFDVSLRPSREQCEQLMRTFRRYHLVEQHSHSFPVEGDVVDVTTLASTSRELAAVR